MRECVWLQFAEILAGQVNRYGKEARECAKALKRVGALVQDGGSPQKKAEPEANANDSGASSLFAHQAGLRR